MMQVERLCRRHLLHRKQLSLSAGLRQLSNQTQENSDDDPRSKILRNVKRELEEDKARMQWRKPISERPGYWYSNLQLFGDDQQTSDFIIMMQQPWDLSPKGLKSMWSKRKERIERAMQQFIPQRNEILGPELAAAHFILFRGGAVKFTNADRWWRANDDGEFDLPSRFHPAYKVEAMRCDNMTLYYEGLENIRCLHNLKFLSFHNVKQFDDWSLDRVSGSEFIKLEVLDISGTNCTARGLSCLYRIPSLKLLIVDNPKADLEFELSAAMLEEVIPNLKIVGAETVHQKDEADK